VDINKEAQCYDMFYQADKLIEEKHFTEATKMLEDILVENPEYGKAYNHLGWLFANKFNDSAKAEELYKKSIFYTPEYPAAYINLVYLYSDKKKWKEMEELINTALPVPGINTANLYNEYAVMQELKGEYDDAIEKYKLAIRSSLIDTNIESYKTGIARCTNKKKFFFTK
jgi:tetratricopeptide (TPR) repeat protein